MGSVSIEKVHRGQYLQEVTALCQEHHFASAELIKGILQWEAKPPIDDTVGFVLLDDGVVCGFAGCMKTLRTIGGKPVIVNAASSAIVKEEYRSYSIKLFQLLFSEGDLVLDLTPTDETYRFLMSPFFRCRQLDSAAIAFSRFRLPVFPKAKAVTDVEKILELAPQQNKEQIKENAAYRGRFCAVTVEGETVILMCRVFAKAKLVRIADILYIDRPELFAKYSQRIMSAVCRKLHTCFCWCDLRFLPRLKIETPLIERSQLFQHPLPVLFGRFTPIRRNSIYRIVTPNAEHVTPLDLDGLYSEKIMM